MELESFARPRNYKKNISILLLWKFTHLRGEGEGEQSVRRKALLVHLPKCLAKEGCLLTCFLGLVAQNLGLLLCSGPLRP